MPTQLDAYDTSIVDKIQFNDGCCFIVTTRIYSIELSIVNMRIFSFNIDECHMPVVEFNTNISSSRQNSSNMEYC
jgi:hypothetical protein